MKIFLLVILLASTFSQADEKVERYLGFATNDKKQLVYTEEHEVHYRNGAFPYSDPIFAKTTYTDTDHHQIAVLETHFETGSLSLPNYTFKDQRLNYEEGIKVSDHEIEMFHKGKSKKISRDSEMMAGQGFHYYVREHLPQIEKGNDQDVTFLIPSRFDQYGFKIVLLDEDKKSGTLSIRLKIRSFVLRMFAPNLDATYDVKTGHLTYYKGASNILTPSGDVQNVEIRYEYPAEKSSK